MKTLSFSTGFARLLTTGVDSLLGTAGNDTFNALVSNSAADTLNAGDSLDGGAGYDILNVVQVDGALVDIESALIVNIEELRIDARDGSLNDVYLLDAGFSVVDINLNGRTQNGWIDVYDLAVDSTITIRNANMNGRDIYLDYGAGTLNATVNLNNLTDLDYLDIYSDGDEDSVLNLNIDNVDYIYEIYVADYVGVANIHIKSAIDIDYFDFNDGAGLINLMIHGDTYIYDFYTYWGYDEDDFVFNITLHADLEIDYLDLPDDSDTTTLLNVTGAGNLKLNDFYNAAGIGEITVDAATATGNIDINFGSYENVVSVTTGSGDDRIVLEADYFVADSELVVALGAGFNTLGISDVTSDVDLAALNFTDVTLSGVNALEFADAISLGADVTLDLNGIGDISKLVFEDFYGVGNEFTIDGATDVFAIEANVDFDWTSLVIDDVTDLTISAGEYLYIDDIDAADLVDLTLSASDVVEAYLGYTMGYDLSSLETLTVTGADLNDDSYHYVEIYDGASALTTVTMTGNWSGLYVDGAAALETVTLTGGSDFWGADAYLDVYNAESLTTATLSGLEADVYLVDTPAFKTLDLSAIADYAYVDAELAAFESAVTILIGESDLDYYAEFAGLVRETIKFVGEDIGIIEIYDFTVGVGGNGDRLDFSAFAGVTALDDLTMVYNGFDTFITSEGFEGDILLVGVDASSDAFNFIFA